MKIKIILLVIAIDLISSLNEPKNIEFDTTISIDDDKNNNFVLDYERQGIPFIIVMKPKNDLITIAFQSISSSSSSYINAILTRASEIKLNYGPYKVTTTGEGTFWLHPMDSEINIDFTEECYEIPELIDFEEYNGPLIYNVFNLKKKYKCSSILSYY